MQEEGAELLYNGMEEEEEVESASIAAVAAAAAETDREEASEHGKHATSPTNATPTKRSRDDVILADMVVANNVDEVSHTEQGNDQKEPNSCSTLDATPSCDPGNVQNQVTSSLSMINEEKLYHDELCTNFVKYGGGQRHAVYFQSKGEQLQKACQQGDYAAVLELAERIPHIKEYAPLEMKRLAKALSEWQSASADTVDNEEDLDKALEDEDVLKILSRDECEIYEALGLTRQEYLDLIKEKLITQKKTLFYKRKRILQGTEAIIHDTAWAVRNCVWKVGFHAECDVESWVRTLVGLRTADACAGTSDDRTTSEGNSKDENYSSSSTSSSAEQQTEDEKQVYSFARVIPQPDYILSQLYENAKIIDDGIFAETVLYDHDASHDSFKCARLENISDAYNKSIERFAKSDLGTKDGQIEKLLEWFTGVVSGDNPNMEMCCNDPLYFPGPMILAKEGVHRVLPHLWLLLGGSFKNESSPPENNVTVHEKPFENIDNCKERVVDAVVSVIGTHYAKIIRADGIEVVAKLRQGQTKDDGPLELIAIQREQLLGHLGRQIGCCLYFGGGIGIPIFVTGVIAGLGHVQILQLHLIAPGTPHSKLELRATRLLPLMTEKNFELWFKSDHKYKKFKAEWKKLQQLLYPKKLAMDKKWKTRKSVFDDILLASTHCYDVDKDQIPLGWKAIWSVMASNPKELFNAGDTDICDVFGSIIGFGAFSNVFHKDSCNWVTKVSTSGVRSFIRNEVQHLLLLKPNQLEYPETVAHYEKSGYRKFSMGGVEVALPFIEISPKGESLYFYLLMLCHDKKQDSGESYWDAIRNIGEGLKDALEFIHNHNVCHNDVKDNNVVVKNGKPILVDFGCAACVEDEKVGFLGTTQYAHRKVHLLHTWKCKKEYDFTSLGFTMATILNGGNVGWTGLSSGPVEEELSHAFQERILCAQQIVVTELTKSKGKANLKDLSDLFLSWIELDLK